MDTYTAAADKLFDDVRHLERILDQPLSDARIELALSVAKRGRRDCTLLIRALASHRDKLHEPGGSTSA